MTATTDQQRLSAIRKRLDDATSGPWHLHPASGVMSGWYIESGGDKNGLYGKKVIPALPGDRGADARLIAHAPGDIAYLLAQLSTPKPEALSREGWEFDGAAEKAAYIAHILATKGYEPLWRNGQFTVDGHNTEFVGWLARARIAHTETQERTALSAALSQMTSAGIECCEKIATLESELTEARKRIVELEAQNAAVRASLNAVKTQRDRAHADALEVAAGIADRYGEHFISGDIRTLITPTTGEGM